MWKGERAKLVPNNGWNKISGISIPMSCIMHLSAAANIAQNTTTLIPIDTTDKDNTGFMSDTTNHQIKIKRAGEYFVAGTAQFVNLLANTEVLAYLYQNTISGTQIANIRGALPISEYPQLGLFSFSWTLASGDTAQIYGRHNQTGTQQFYGDTTQATSLQINESPTW